MIVSGVGNRVHYGLSLVWTLFLITGDVESFHP